MTMKKRTTIAVGLVTAAILAVMLIVASSERSVGNAQTSITAGLTLPNRNLYALTTDNSLYILRPGATQYSRLGRIGDTAGGNVYAMDFRPADRQLYVLTDLGAIYTVNLSSSNFGATTLVSTMNPRCSNGIGCSIDFNPVLNALRVMGTNEQNLAVVNQNGGNLNATAVQTNFAYVAGDVNAGRDPQITGCAYTNNVVGAANTRFLMIDANADTLVTIQDENATGSSNTGAGRLQTLGSFVDNGGNRINMSDLTGIDVVTINGVNMLVGQTTRLLFTINLGQVNLDRAVGTTQNVVVLRGAAGIQLPNGAPQLSGGVRALKVQL